MKLIRGIYNLKASQGCVATIGNFDGVHLGHQKVLQQLISKAESMRMPSTVITFEPLPQEFFQGTLAPARLLRFGEKLRVLQQYPINTLLCLPFTNTLSQLPAEAFVSEILVKKMGIKWLIVGDDFHFGYKRAGDYSLLQQMGLIFEFGVTNTETVQLNNQRVGSSHVRKALAEGNFLLAQQLLGHPYMMSGRVVYGDQRGRQLGFPTANIPLHRRVSPLNGVFVVWVHGFGDRPLPGVANVGKRPTVDGTHGMIEVYLLDFNQQIYGKRLQVEFLRKLRNEQRFSGLTELQQQIARDVQEARDFFLSKVTS